MGDVLGVGHCLVLHQLHMLMLAKNDTKAKLLSFYMQISKCLIVSWHLWRFSIGYTVCSFYFRHYTLRRFCLVWRWSCKLWPTVGACRICTPVAASLHIINTLMELKGSERCTQIEDMYAVLHTVLEHRKCVFPQHVCTRCRSDSGVSL